MNNENMLKELEKICPSFVFQWINRFLHRGFAEDAEESLLEIFLQAQKDSVPFDKVMVELEAEWMDTWYIQHPGLRGSIYLPGDLGIRNRVAFEKIRGFLGFPA